MKRFAVYYAPDSGAFADAGARWLGWDPVAGTPVAQPETGPDLAAVTTDPRRYGFHGTLKPPFRLADGTDLAALQAAMAGLAHSLAPVQLPGLAFGVPMGFLALVPTGNTQPLRDLAAAVVERLDPFRAPLTAAEIARRKPHLLTPRQRQLLDRYGYPHVMEHFRFHLTLTGPLTQALQAGLMNLAQAHFAPHLPTPFRVADLCLFGEAEDGRFHLMQRYPLG